MPAPWARRAVLVVGFVAGATVGGSIGWSVGYAAWHRTGGSDLVWGVLFFLSFVGLLFGLVAPLALVRFVSDRATPLGGEPGDDFMGDSWAANYVVNMALGRQLGNYVGYVAIVGFYLALAGIAAVVYGGDGGLSPLEVLAFFDAVGGAVLGGIAVVAMLARRAAG